MSQKTEIVQQLKALRPLLVERYAISYLGLFGSVIREDAQPDSDVDILVEIDWAQKTLKGFDFLNLHEDLEKSLGKKVDLVSRSNLHPILEPYILSEAFEITP